MHLVSDDGFEHETAHVSMKCPCGPYPKEIPDLVGLYLGSRVTHRDMRVPDHVPEEWIEEGA